MHTSEMTDGLNDEHAYVTVDCKEACMMKQQRLSIQDHPVILHLEGELSKQADVIGLTESDLQVAKAIQPIVEKHIIEIVTCFYDAIGKEESLMQKIREHSTIDRLRHTLQKHVLEMLAGRIDAAYITRRQQVARTHLRIQLMAKWYIGSFAELERAIIEICERYIDARDMTVVRDAIRRLLSLEKQIVLESFDEAADAMRAQMAEMKQRISEQVNDSASELAVVTQESSASVEELVAQSQHIVAFAHSVAEIAVRVEQSSSQGMKQIEEQLMRLQEIHAGVENIGERNQSLRTAADRIGDIAAMVREVSETTNLLALNAAIQAAQAGEHGQGFAVVANEVKKLASQTGKMAEEVSEMIHAIRHEIRAVSDALPIISGGVADANESMQETSGFFETLVQEMGTIRTKTEEIETELEDSVRALEEVARSISQVAAASDELNRLTSRL
jgi:heme-based aerotactic transducer